MYTRIKTPKTKVFLYADIKFEEIQFQYLIPAYFFQSLTIQLALWLIYFR